MKLRRASPARGEEYLRSFFEASIFGMTLYSPKREWLVMNDAFCRMLGYSREELMQLSFKQITHPDDLELDKAQFKRVLAGEIDGYVLDKRYIRKDQSVFEATLALECIRDKSGEVDYVVAFIQDQTVRRKAEQVLKENQSRYRALFDESPVPLWEEDFTEVKRFIEQLRKKRIRNFRKYFDDHPEAVAGCAGKVKILDVNKAAIALHQGESKQAIQAGLMNIFTEESLHVFKEELICIAEGKTRFKTDCNVKTLGGRRIHVAVDWLVVPGHEESLDKVYVSTVDISSRKKAEEELLESRRLFTTLLDNLPGMFYRCANDPDWTLEFASQAILQLTGRPARDFLEGRIHWGDIIHPDDREAVWNSVQTAVNDQRPFQLEYRIRHADGSTKWVWEQGRGVVDSQGRLIFLEGYIMDITERVLAKEKLEFTQFAIDNCGDPAFWLDPDDRFIYVNDAACRSLGYTREELLLLTVFDIDPSLPRDSGPEFWRRIKQQGYIEMESVHRRKDGNIFPVSIHATHLNFNENDYACSFVRDITERKKSEDELLQSRERLRNLATWLNDAMEMERTRIARDIHDELGQSLTGVKMDLAWLADRLPDKDREALTGRIHAAVELVDSTINFVGRLSSSLRPTLLDDFGLVAALDWQLQGFSGRTGIQCTARLTPEDLAISHKMETAIFRIFQEALTNVARHSGATRVDVSMQKRENRVELSIADNGVGIEAGKLMSNRSFGLIGMRERAFAFGGEIRIERLAQGGTGLTLTMPIGGLAA